MSSPELQGPGFSTTTLHDHRSWLWVAGFLSLIYSIVCLAARLVAKWGLLWYDDSILAIAYATAVTHWALLFHSISRGLGASNLTISPEIVASISKTYFGSRIPLLIANCLAKLSILVFTRRIFAGDIYKENFWFGISYASVLIYGIAAVLLSSAGCRSSESLVASTNAVCDHNTARWAVITAMDGITELVILAMPIWFISRNRLKASKKRVVISVYAFRLIVIGCSIAFTTTYLQWLKNGRDNIDIVPVVVWEEVLLGFSLISASFPCLRSFIWAFMSRGLMTMYGNTTASQSASRSASVQLRSFNKSLHPSRQDSDTGESRVRLRPDQHNYQVNVSHGALPGDTERGRGNTDASDDSVRMIIHQETTYRVDSIRV